MYGFEMLKQDKRAIFKDGPFSTKCILYNTEKKKIQGLGSTLSTDNPNYDPDDVLMCIAPFIGLDIDITTGFGAFADRAEITLNMDDITIGDIKNDWCIDVWFPTISKWFSFKVENVAPDRMLGTYLIKPTLIQKVRAATPERISLGGTNGADF